MMTKSSETVQPSLLKSLTMKRGKRFTFNDNSGSTTAAVSTTTTPSLHDNTIVTCFDIFDGYNKAVELWQADEKPSMQRLGVTVGIIGELMVEMSAQLQDDHSTIPPFLHYPIDTKDLERLGISGVFTQNGSQAIRKAGHHPIHKLKRDWRRGSTSSDQKVKGIDKGGGGLVLNARQEDQLKHKVTEPHQSLMKFQDHIETMKRLSEPKRHGSRLLPEHLQVPSHFFQRWIWVQFPWLALTRAIEPRKDKVGGSKEGVVNVVNSTTTTSLNRLGAVQRMIDAGHMNKKQGVKAATAASLTDLKTNVGGVQSKHKQNVAFTTSRRADRGIYPDLPTSNSITSEGVLKSAGIGLWSGLNPALVPQSIQNNNNNNTFDDEGFLPQTKIHFSSSSRSVLKGGLLFKKTNSLIQNQGDGDCIDKNTKPEAAAAAWRSIDSDGTTQFMSILPSVMNNLNSDSTMMDNSIGNSSRPSAMPPLSEELAVQKAQAKVKGLRSILDCLLKERNDKSQLLKNLSISLHLRYDQNAHVASETAAGEKVVCALKTRLSAAQVAAEDTRELRNFFKSIINACKKKPPQEKLHLSALEHQVKLADQQMKDLVTHMCPILEETNEIEEKGIQGFREHLTRVQKVRAQVEERADKLRANIEHIMAKRKIVEDESQHHHHAVKLKTPMFAMRVKRITSVFPYKTAKPQGEGMVHPVVSVSKEIPISTIDNKMATVHCEGGEKDKQHSPNTDHHLPVNNNSNPVVVNHSKMISSTAVRNAMRNEGTNDDDDRNMNATAAAADSIIVPSLDELLVSTGAKVVEELPCIVHESLDTQRKLLLESERLSQQAEELMDQFKANQEEISKVKAVGVDTESLIECNKQFGQDLWALEAISIKGKNIISSPASHRMMDKDMEAANIRYQQACGRLCSAQSLLSEVTSSVDHIERLCNTILPQVLESLPPHAVTTTTTTTTPDVGKESTLMKRLESATERLLSAVNNNKTGSSIICCPPLQSPENGTPNEALPSFWVSGFSPGRLRTEAANVNASDVCTTLDRTLSIEMETGKGGCLEASSCDVHVVAEKYRDLRFQTDLQMACQDDGALLTTEAEEKKLGANLYGTSPLIGALRSSESMNLLRKANMLMPSAVQQQQ